MLKNIMLKFGLLSFFILVFLVISCDSIVESLDSGFKTEKYEMLAIDTLAAAIFSDTLITDIVPAIVEKIEIVSGTDTTIVYGLKYAGVTDTISDNQSITILNSLYADSARLSAGSVIFNVKSSPDSFSTYYCYDCNASEKSVFYFTDYAKMNLTDENGNTLNVSSDMMPLETIAGYFTVQGTYAKSVIKARYEYDLSPGKYLIEFITTDQTVSRTFEAVVLEE
ncbi:MAG: hypothetical protein ISS29_06060 [Candidatus Marinimicrobia bacterium]|nr:hypothetical protein [Candidatus Neomarinimicrobiota bacterium]